MSIVISTGTPIVTLVGGFHLFAVYDVRLDWPGRQMQVFGFKRLIGARCTGFKAVHRLRCQLKLSRGDALAATGSSYSLTARIVPDASGSTR